MSMVPIRSRFSRKTLAIALAAGVSFSGIQVVSAQTGHDTAGQAVAAEADGDHRNINDQVTYDSLQFFLKDGSGLDPNKKYENTHRVTRFKGSGKIADGAKAGDQFTITTGTENSYKRMGNLVVGKREVTKENLAPGEEDSYRSYEETSSKLFKWGEHYTLFAKDGKTSLGDLNVDGDKMTFTLNDNVTNRQDLSFQFDIPTDFEVGSTSYYPGSKSFQYWPGDEDVPSNYDGVDNTHSEFYIYYGNGEKQKVGVYDKFTVSQYRYSELKDVHYVEEKASLAASTSHANGTLRQDLGLIKWYPYGIGVRAINTSDEEQTARAVFTLPDEVPLTDEDIEKLARPSAGASSDDKNEFSNFLVSGYGSQEYGLEQHKKIKWPSGTVHYGAGEGEFLKNQKFDDYVDVSIDKKARTITWLVKVPAKSKIDIDLATKEISTGYVPDMSNGKHKYKTTSTAEWVSDAPLTKPWSGNNSWNLDLGSAGANGTNIVRKPGLEAYLNDANPDKPSGKTADGKNSLAPTAKEAIVDNDGTADLTLALKNDKGSNVSLTNPTITLPDGKKVTEKLTLKPGETQYKTYKVDLSKFKKTPAKLPVSMQFVGAEKLTDEVWFTTTKTAENFDPNWADTKVPDGGSVDVTPTNTKDIPKGTKYKLTNNPDWITINPDTGVITAKPPQGEEPAPHKVTVTTTYPDGSTDTDTPTITVTHSDVFIDGTPTVKPDGTVTLHRNDGEDITFKVPTGSKVEVNKDGDLVITQPDGKKETVPLKHTTVTEKGEPGKLGHKIVITDENGKVHEFDGFDTYVESVTKQPNGDYLIKRNDGENWTIKLSDIRNDIKNLKGKDNEQDKRLDDLENRVDGIDKDLNDLGDRITRNEGAIEDHRKSINDLNQEVGSINNELGDIKSELDRLDGQDIKEVRDNGDGTYTLIRNNGDEVTGIIDTSGDISNITDNGNGTITLTKNDGSTEVVDLTHTKVETKGKPGDKDYTVTITTPDGNTVTLNGSNTYPSKVTDNGDGTYTIILNDGTKVPGVIGDGQDIKELVPNEDGTMTVIHKDGSKSTVDLKQVEITEDNEGTPEHTVTITSPNGDTVTFNVFDVYVTDVVKQEDGNYKVIRNDGTEWIIDLSDIRDRIAALEAKDSPTRDEFNAVKRDLDDLNTKVDNEFKNIDDRFTKIEGDIANLRADLTDLEARVTKVENRLTVVETRTDDLTKCVAGAGMAGIPAMLSIPLMMMTQLNIPGLKDLNTEIQKQIGIYNPDLARAWERHGGILQAGAALAGLAGIIGGIAYVADQCRPAMETDAAQDTDLGKLSSKLDEAKNNVEQSSKKETDTVESSEETSSSEK